MRRAWAGIRGGCRWPDTRPAPTSPRCWRWIAPIWRPPGSRARGYGPSPACRALTPFLPLDGPITTRTFGHADDLPATQPISFVRADAPAAFLATGEGDQTVRPRNTRKLAKALREAGAIVEEQVYPGLDHAAPLLALSRPFRRKAPVLAQMTAFLKARGG